MANRVLIGKNVNSNHGHSSASPGYGLYISRPNKDVTSCTADELIFNTDNGQVTSVARIIGLFQLAPIDTNNNTTTTTTLSSGATATIDISSINYGLDLGFIGYGGVTTTTTDSSALVSYTNNFSAETITLKNETTASLNVKTYLQPRYTTNAFF